MLCPARPPDPSCAGYALGEYSVQKFVIEQAYIERNFNSLILSRRGIFVESANSEMTKRKSEVLHYEIGRSDNLDV